MLAWMTPIGKRLGDCKGAACRKITDFFFLAAARKEAAGPKPKKGNEK
jgi:hypothetical protein